jgi:hypothetical protein
MWSQFLLENIHFAIYVFASLIFFATFWLYFDAWLVKKTIRETFKIAGFLLLSLSFLLQATFIESSLLQVSLFGLDVHTYLYIVLRLLGYIFLIGSLIFEPLQPKPQTRGVGESGFIGGGLGASILSMLFSFPILSAGIGVLYLRRATIGLENHIKPVAYSFLILSISELLSLRVLLGQTNNVTLYNLFSPFGIIWLLQHAILLISVLVLRSWVFGYLLKRFQSQLFIIFTTSIMAVFLIITICFTALLLKNLEDQSLSQIQTDAKVLNLTIDAEQAVNLSDAQVLSQNAALQKAVLEKSVSDLSTITQDFLIAKKENSLLVLDDNGAVLMRGENRDQRGDSLSSDPLIKRALLGQAVSTVTSVDGPLSPRISITSASPVMQEKRVIGVVMVSVFLDSAFLDGLKKASGLEASILGKDQISATTLVSADQKTRPLGLKEANETVKDTVLTKGQPYQGSVSILNTPYLAAYLPLLDIDNTPVGMIFIGREQAGVLQTAAYSIEMTFTVVTLLLVLSVIPSFLIARSLERQIG